jgi:hypothetical protein
MQAQALVSSAQDMQAGGRVRLAGASLAITDDVLQISVAPPTGAREGDE